MGCCGSKENVPSPMGGSNENVPSPMGGSKENVPSPMGGSMDARLGLGAWLLGLEQGWP
jgi:hypothetical protein